MRISVAASARVLALTLLLLVEALRAEETTTSTNTTGSTESTSRASTTTTSPFIGGVNEKIARRIIDERLTPPRATDFAPWNKRLPLTEVQHRVNGPPRVTEEVDDSVMDRAVPKKTRTVGSTQEPNCCAGKTLNEKEKSSQNGGGASDALDLERGNVGGPAARFHGNRPNDDRYGHNGWRSSSYLGFGKDKGYYDQRNHYPYDRYNPSQRPNSNYAAQDGDRYGAPQRPSASYSILDGDRYGSGSNSRPGSYQNANYNAYGVGSAYGGGGDRPRPGGNYGISGSITGEGDTDYPFGEGGPPTGLTPNLQTQKAVALKALAGVALIGAAAALASNPVLLPISVISGRRKRSVSLQSDNYALTALLQGYILSKPNEKRSDRGEKSNETTASSLTSRQELVITPQCVARLACHVHRDYLDELEKSKAELSAAAGASDNADGGSNDETDENAFRGLEHWFDSLVHSNILVADYLSEELKSLIRSAINVGSNRNESCDVFSCLNLHDSSRKKTT